MEHLIERFLAPILITAGSEERRRAIAIHQIGIAGGLLGVCYAAMNAWLELWYGAASNLFFGLMFLGIAQLCRLGFTRGMRHILLWSTNIYLTTTALWVFGADCGGHHYLLAAAITGSLLFSLKEWPWKFVYLSVGLVLFYILEYELMLYAPIETIPPAIAWRFELVSTGGSVCFVFFFLYVYQVAVIRAERALKYSHKRSEDLLLNILPLPVAERLKQGDSVVDRFEEVTVLFADIASFTKLSSGMIPRDIVEMLNEIFSAFDWIADRYGVEKIKTIGDAYMVAGGIPEAGPGHARAIADMAVEMRDWMKIYRDENGLDIGLRIGIHSGPVVAGVIGARKFTYDLWGDTVNLASRMESHGVVDEIQISEAVYEKLKDDYVIESRGEIVVKGKGEMRVWILSSRK